MMVDPALADAQDANAKLRADIESLQGLNRELDRRLSGEQKRVSMAKEHWLEAADRAGEQRARADQAEAKLAELAGFERIHAQQMFRLGGLEDVEDRLHEAEARIAAVRAAVHIADAEDVTDWQRGYRASTDRALAALGCTAAPVPDPALVAAEEALTRVMRLAETLPAAVRDRIGAAIDGPAEQPAGPVALPRPEDMVDLVAMAMDANNAATLRRDNERWDAVLAPTVMPERARAAAGQTLFRATAPVEEVAGHPDMLAAWLAGMRDYRAAHGVTPEWLGRIEHEGFPAVADDSLPPGEIHLRPHPRPADGPS